MPIRTPDELEARGCDPERLGNILDGLLDDAVYNNGAYRLNVIAIEAALGAPLIPKTRALAIELFEAAGWAAHFVGEPSTREQLVCRRNP